MKLFFWFLPLLFSFQSVYSFGQNVEAFSLGNTGVSQNTAQGIRMNPASLSQIQNNSLHIDALNLFSINSLHQFSAGAALNLKHLGNIGIHFQQFGFESFRDQKAKLSYSHKILDRLDLGVQGIYLKRSIDNYGSKQLFSAAFGFISKLTTQIQIGGLIANPFPLSWSSNEKLLPQMILGMHYRPSDKVDIDFDIEKSFDTKLNAKVGVSYHPLNSLDVNIGINSNPSLVSFGFGLLLRASIKINMGASYHQILGFSSGLGLSYQFSSQPKLD